LAAGLDGDPGVFDVRAAARAVAAILALAPLRYIPDGLEYLRTGVVWDPPRRRRRAAASPSAC